MTNASQNLSRTIVLIDAYSSGSLYPAEFKQRGYECAHVQSSIDLDPTWLDAFQPEDFVKKIIHRGDVEETIQQLARFLPVAVIAGAECGVMLADELSEKMGLKTNGTKLSEARRNKYLTHEILRQRGLRCANQIRSDKVEEILAWATKRNIWPMVIKPLDGAGSECVRFCHSIKEIKEAFSNILGKKNNMGRLNHAVLAQEFLNGDEYVVDTVSCNGRHAVCAIFKYTKIKQNNCFIYENEILLSSTGSPSDVLSCYGHSVLDALRVQYGPTHMEIMLTKADPCLVELNARLDGDKTPALVQQCTGYGQVKLSADSYLDKDSFSQHTQEPYALNKHGCLVHLMSEHEGKIKAIRYLDQAKKLPSFFSLTMSVGVGDLLQKTVDIDSRPGLIKLAHENLAVVNQDHKTIRAWERDGIFVI